MNRVGLQQAMSDALVDPNTTKPQLVELLTSRAHLENPIRDILGEPWHAVHLAAVHPNPELLEALLQHGANPNVAGADGTTPLLLARSVAHLECLFTHGATYPAANQAGDTPLLVAYRQGDLSRVTALCAHGAPRDELQAGSLHWAVIARDPDLRAAIAANLSELNRLDVLGWTPLMLALRAGELDAARAMAEAGAEPSVTDKDGNSGLHLAVFTGSLEAVKCAVEAMVFVEIENQDGEQAFDLAMKRSEGMIAQYLASARHALAPISDELDLLLQAEYDGGEVHYSLSLLEPDEMLEKPRVSLGCARTLAQVSPEEFLRAAVRRFGRMNPDLSHEPFWQAMVATHSDPFDARTELVTESWTLSFREKLMRRFGLTSEPSQLSPIWSNVRRGQSTTWLASGRVIQIGGTFGHEYSTDYCVYNDVIVHEAGKPARVFLYPCDVFPPTDFHTATVVGDWIYVIGALGYLTDRDPETCPIYRIHVLTMHIEKVTPTGDDPGRMFCHEAVRLEGNRILVRQGKLSTHQPPFNQSCPPRIFDPNRHAWLPVTTPDLLGSS